ncbi:unnamed protein product [Linum tenue]|uniref:Uncharacterized protein n=1 Tax=Linum tenue TaxID=586396 RepID=A0AAV0KG22_9ROSI|nr:unnamed protein product [Linum tenue]
MVCLYKRLEPGHGAGNLQRQNARCNSKMLTQRDILSTQLDSMEMKDLTVKV